MTVCKMQEAYGQTNHATSMKVVFKQYNQAPQKGQNDL